MRFSTGIFARDVSNLSSAGMICGRSGLPKTFICCKGLPSDRVGVDFLIDGPGALEKAGFPPASSFLIIDVFAWPRKAGSRKKTALPGVVLLSFGNIFVGFEGSWSVT